jgi:hypothetical protein
MESDSGPEAPVGAPSIAELRERERLIRRSGAAPHLDGSGVSWPLVVAGSLANTALVGVLYLIVHEEMLWLIWLALLPPIGGPLLWNAASRLLRRRNGVAPAATNQPRELKRLEVRLAALGLPLELGILLLVAFTPAWLALSAAFGASLLVFWALCAVYARKARAPRAPAA